MKNKRKQISIVKNAVLLSEIIFSDSQIFKANVQCLSIAYTKYKIILEKMWQELNMDGPIRKKRKNA